MIYSVTVAGVQTHSGDHWPSANGVFKSAVREHRDKRIVLYAGTHVARKHEPRMQKDPKQPKASGETPWAVLRTYKGALA